MTKLNMDFLLKAIEQKDKELKQAEKEAFSSEITDPKFKEQYNKLEKIRQEVMDLNLQVSNLSSLRI
ncbi:hypothetical protein BK120_00705 [Paenibacillus sp. FSL A5-0031]|uniref:hypothetical protein n=1 Tax=Paenibacillus sp. FSL A5-0031 TaxID=1920420 RepID=UPI00096C1228|nr:hypothetical protein [Paenibacillus sp. FSL A5-0031]OME87884.1 hypothetical protein BK120_00705 [Paenibacillus sp. FSL A5-0031]